MPAEKRARNNDGRAGWDRLRRCSKAPAVGGKAAVLHHCDWCNKPVTKHAYYDFHRDTQAAVFLCRGYTEDERCAASDCDSHTEDFDEEPATGSLAGAASAHQGSGADSGEGPGMQEDHDRGIEDRQGALEPGQEQQQQDEFQLHNEQAWRDAAAAGDIDWDDDGDQAEDDGGVSAGPAPAPAAYDELGPDECESEGGAADESDGYESGLSDGEDDSPAGTGWAGAQQQQQQQQQQHQQQQQDYSGYQVPLYPHCRFSVMQAVYFLLCIKHARNISDIAFQEILLAVWLLLPADTSFPTSLYLCKAMFGVRPLKDYEWHVCKNCDKHVWNPTVPKLASDRCPRCKHPRFKSSRQLVPHKAFYYPGIRAAVESLVANPKFNEQRGSDRQWDNANTLYGSPYVAALNADLDCEAGHQGLPASSRNPLHSKANSLFITGDDAGNMWQGGKDSTQISCFRCLDGPSSMVSDRSLDRIICVCPAEKKVKTGKPKEVKRNMGYHIAIAQELRLLAAPGLLEVGRAFGDVNVPDGFSTGLYVTPVLQRPDGSYGADICNAFWMGIFGPFMQCDRMGRICNCGMEGGNNSVMSCHFCAMNGTHIAGAVRPLGYVDEVKATQGKLAGQKYLVGREDEKRQIDTEEQRVRAQHMELRGKLGPLHEKYRGLSGNNVMNSMIPYSDRNLMWPLSFCHAVFFGLAKGFVSLIFPAVGKKRNQKVYSANPACPRAQMMLPPEMRPTKAALKVVEELSGNMVVSWNFRHSHKSPVSDRGYYIMEDYMRLVDTYMVLLFGAAPGQSSLHPRILQAWGHLRRFIEAHMRSHPKETAASRAARILAARAELLNFAKIVYEFIDVKLMTPNLHDLLCQLHIQELNLGDTIGFLELWVEGMIQVAKKRVKGRATKNTAQVIVNDILLGYALDLHKYRHGKVLHTVAEEFESRAAAEKGEKPWGPEYDPVCGEEGADCFPDKGQRAEASDVATLLPKIIKAISDNPSSDKAQQTLDLQYLKSMVGRHTQLVVWVHKEASREGLYRINSRAYKAQQSRESFWVLAAYDPMRPAAVTRYIRVQLSSLDGAPRFLRLAMCQFWPVKPTWVDRDLGNPLYRFYLHANVELPSEYPLRFESIEAPMVYTTRVLSPGIEEFRFTTYSHSSGHKK